MVATLNTGSYGSTTQPLHLLGTINSVCIVTGLGMGCKFGTNICDPNDLAITLTGLAAIG